MAFSLVSSVTTTSGSGGGETGYINTTGADLLVLSVSWYTGGSGTSLTISDSKGNTWTPLTVRNTATTAQRPYYAKSPTVGTTHSAFVTAPSGGIYPVVTFSAYSGADLSAPFVVENGATATGGVSLATGSVTPTVNGSLLVSGWAGMNGTSNPTVG